VLTAPLQVVQRAHALRASRSSIFASIVLPEHDHQP
jgi:hypothetical protein